MRTENITTIGELLYWAYANLGMAHSAVTKGSAAYAPINYVVRNKLYSGLTNGTMDLGSLRDDERLKLVLGQACCYCGTRDRLTLDHVIPLSRGGVDCADNLLWACSRCNSSKGATDLMEWYQRAGAFPPLLLIRRYLKLAIIYCRENGLMDVGISDPVPLPFALRCIPLDYPAPGELALWVVPL